MMKKSTLTFFRVVLIALTCVFFAPVLGVTLGVPFERWAIDYMIIENIIFGTTCIFVGSFLHRGFIIEDED